MIKKRIFALIVLLLGLGLGWAVLRGEQPNAPKFLADHPFRLGLDLSGGTHLLYSADVSKLSASQIDDSMNALRDVIERRINLFGVGEPVVQVQTGSFGSGGDHRLSIELPGITDIGEAIKMIGQTPFLEFRVQSDKPQEIVVDKDGNATIDPNGNFVPTPLNGKYLKSAQLSFNSSTGEPIVNLNFNDEGAKMFEQITRDNVGKTVAIYLDGQVISAPVVREAISGGQAQISGNFTPEEGRALVGRLNSGALPVPISLISTETIGATLGEQATSAGIKSALIGFLAIAFFLILWYRLPGLIASIALVIYIAITLALYKLIPVTLSSAGIAGFIISIGMAVDANILIFERFKEERKKGRGTRDALSEGFSKAWLSIRDANTASIIISIILFWFGSSLIKGFALTFGLGVVVSLVSAIGITRVFLRALPTMENSKVGKFLFSNGFIK
ncbi:MAG TPA: protein translocase subunit SecD [Candidatus Paceibacterota bacterium]|nr:protein translocase subunit SecD [Candidatus Paceibacterota bacterium]